MQTLQKTLLESQEKIRALIPSALFETSCLITDIEAKIMENLRWGLFYEHAVWSLDGQNLSAIHDFMVQSSGVGLLSSKNLKTLKNKMFDISYNSETYQCYVLPTLIQREATVSKPEFLMAGASPFICLPDYSKVFKSLIEGSVGVDDTWLYDYVDEYEDFKRLFEVKKYMQIGGFGQFIQTDYDDSYVGQINIGMGDGGSLYIYSSHTDLSASVEMY